ncbi:hypothetical protein AB1Y20_019625 [Prymnesium parvum]|uniref:N-acetyltransferase domain-containing protein n=1 Tax=Prymnesium parvum TaxID=97485 RepID=A0AB34JUY9_PRYPA|mmetsp:Transcript_5813/g.14749  ORF Transcript_5813/g.14749 Transcript_5813/m.14749 type:complete len:243 (+) Transcript_5813:28-756(+)
MGWLLVALSCRPLLSGSTDEPVDTIHTMCRPWSTHTPQRACRGPRNGAVAMGLPELSLAEVTAADVRLCAELTVAGFYGELGEDYGFNNNRATAYFELLKEQREDLVRSLREEGTLHLLARAGAEAVGFVRVRRVRHSDPLERGVLLDNLVVRRDARRQGVARRLVREAEARVRSHGVAQELYLLVEQSNEAARAFYASEGWEELPDAHTDATRYRLDWWRGRVCESCVQLAMRHRLLDCES